MGLLAEGATHGYELERLIRARGVRNWTSLGTSSIYYVLRRLEDHGLIVSHKESPAEKARREFKLTHEGRKMCAEGSLRLLREVKLVHAPVLVGMANLELLDRSDVLLALRERRNNVAECLEGLIGARTNPDVPLVARLIFDHPAAVLEAELKWIDGTIATLEEIDD